MNSFMHFIPKLQDMKKLLLLILVPVVSFGQFEWDHGYKLGNKNRYCNEK